MNQPIVALLTLAVTSVPWLGVYLLLQAGLNTAGVLLAFFCVWLAFLGIGGVLEDLRRQSPSLPPYDPPAPPDYPLDRGGVFGQKPPGME